MPELARLSRHRNGVPVYRYPTGSETPPVTVLRAGGHDVLDRGRHIHDFPALWFVADRGIVFVVAAGVAVDPARVARSDDGVAIFFDPAALGEDARSPWPTWRTHPLLFPFLHGRSGGLLQLEIPPTRIALWDSMIASIESELTGRQDGYRQAALAHLTLLLIDVARLADNVVGDLRRSGEPLLADVFAVVERRASEPSFSLRDVADELGMTPGHLTTVVRRRTGKTVQEWIIDRRMAEARRLLTGTDLPIGEVATRVGFVDPGYFTRLFHRVHGDAPRSWRARIGARAG